MLLARWSIWTLLVVVVAVAIDVASRGRRSFSIFDLLVVVSLMTLLPAGCSSLTVVVVVHGQCLR